MSESTLVITESTPAEDAAYSAYVAAHPDAALFHERPWREAVVAAFGHRPHYLLARRGSRVVGVLPMFQINSVVAGRFLLSMPYSTYGGPLADDADATAALLAHARDLAGRIDAATLELRTVRAADPTQPVRSRHARFVRPLPTNVDAFENYLPRKARAAARKAAATAPLTIASGREHLDTAWRLYARSMRRLASPNYPRRFFRALADALGDRMIVQLVRAERRPVAALVSFIHRDTLMPYFIGLDERVELYGLSHYLYQESMRWGVSRGLRAYDFGRSRIDNTGPYNFKRFCGFEPTPLEYQTFVSPGRSAPDLSPGSARWALARDVWKRLPLLLTRPLGGWLARSIPG